MTSDIVRLALMAHNTIGYFYFSNFEKIITPRSFHQWLHNYKAFLKGYHSVLVNIINQILQ